MVENLRRYKHCQSRRFSKEGHFKRKFQVEGDIAHQPLLVSETRVITLLCGIKTRVPEVCSFVSSQSTRVTNGRRDRQNYDPQDRASIAAKVLKL